MIDLHCHILPGLDDGASDLADSVAMARQADADGIAAICATPHIRHDHSVAIDQLAGRVAQLNAELDRAGVACKVLSGGEVSATSVAGLDDSDLARVSLGSGGLWLLLEPAPGALDEGLDAAVKALADRGYRSLIAHPERHLAGDMRARLAHLIGDYGALVQATAAMLLDDRTATGMLELAEWGLIHVLGSDSHSSRHGRPVALSAAFERLRPVSHISDHLTWMACAAPSAIVVGEPLASPFEPRA